MAQTVSRTYSAARRTGEALERKLVHRDDIGVSHTNAFSDPDEIKVYLMWRVTIAEYPSHCEKGNAAD